VAHAKRGNYVRTRGDCGRPGRAFARPAAGDPREATGVREGTLPGTRPAAPPASKMPLYAGIAAVLLLAAGGGAWFFFGRGRSAPAANPPVAASQPTPAGVQPAPTPAGPTQEEIKAQIQQMVAASSQEMGAKMKAQYEDRVKQLQQQLQDAKKRDEAHGAGAAAPKEKPPVPVSVPSAAQEAPAETHTAAKSPEPVVPPPVKPEPTPAPVEKQAAAPPPAAAPIPAPAAPARQVQYGDLVTPGSVPGMILPKMTSRLDPRYPAAAQRMNKSAQVDIKVLVDEKGRVLDAQRSGQQAGFGFDEAALDAARRAVFQPASTKDGVRVKMWTVIRVSFQPHG